MIKWSMLLKNNLKLGYLDIFYNPTSWTWFPQYISNIPSRTDSQSQTLLLKHRHLPPALLCPQVSHTFLMIGKYLSTSSWMFRHASFLWYKSACQVEPISTWAFSWSSWATFIFCWKVRFKWCFWSQTKPCCWK